MHDGLPYGRNQGQGQGHSREVDRQSPTGLIFHTSFTVISTDGKLLQIYINSKTTKISWFHSASMSLTPSSHFLSVFNRPIFPYSPWAKPDSHESPYRKPQEIVGRRIFTGWMPFLMPNQQRQDTCGQYDAVCQCR